MTEDLATNDVITQTTLAWAKLHDWGRDAFLVRGAFMLHSNALCGLRDVQIHADGTTIETEKYFTSRRALRAWAGY
jgi:hypothetical protein